MLSGTTIPRFEHGVFLVVRFVLFAVRFSSFRSPLPYECHGEDEGEWKDDEVGYWYLILMVKEGSVMMSLKGCVMSCLEGWCYFLDFESFFFEMK